jgi:hypothetical protein
MGIRRLPAWVLSHAQEFGANGIRPKPEPNRVCEILRWEVGTPDKQLQLMTDNDRFPVDVWMRQEYLVSDFIRFMSRFDTSAQSKRSLIEELNPKPPRDYNHDWAHWFTAEQIEKLYRENPVWTRVEKLCYE